MNEQRTHYATTSDGVTIGGTVRGHGPALVILQGMIGDGGLDWARTAESLSDRFTCHLPDMRGRGLSGDHPALGIGRLVEDVVTYVESIGEPVGLAGWSGGGAFALYAAARSDAVVAVAPFEPGMLHLLDEREQRALGGALGRAGEHASAGRLAEGVQAFASWPFQDAELDAARDGGYFEAAGRYLPKLLDGIRQASETPPPGDPDAPLGAVSVPVAVLVGSDTKRFFSLSAEHVVEHVPGARMLEIPGAGHAAPLTHPEDLAAALAAFFSPVHQPA